MLKADREILRHKSGLSREKKHKMAALQREQVCVLRNPPN
jgi:hypothetical protein